MRKSVCTEENKFRDMDGIKKKLYICVCVRERERVQVCAL